MLVNLYVCMFVCSCSESRPTPPSSVVSSATARRFRSRLSPSIAARNMGKGGAEVGRTVGFLRRHRPRIADDEYEVSRLTGPRSTLVSRRLVPRPWMHRIRRTLGGFVGFTSYHACIPFTSISTTTSATTSSAAIFLCKGTDSAYYVSASFKHRYLHPVSVCSADQTYIVDLSWLSRHQL